MLIFAEGGKPENPEKNPRSEDENQQQTQPTYDAESGNRTRATLVGGECSPHCAINIGVKSAFISECMLLKAGPNCSKADYINPGLKLDKGFNFSCIRIFLLLIFCGIWDWSTSKL